MQVLNCTMQHAGEVICFMLPGGLEVSLCAAYRPNMDSCNYPVLYSASLPALDYAGGVPKLLLQSLLEMLLRDYYVQTQMQECGD